MTRPTYSIRIDGPVGDVERRLDRGQTKGTVSQQYLTSTLTARAERFTTYAAVPFRIMTFDIWVYIASTGPNRPFDKIRARVWDAAWTVLVTSNESYDADDLPKDTYIRLSFTFPAYTVAAAPFAIGVYRDGSPSLNGRWQMIVFSSSIDDDPMPEGAVYNYSGGIWVFAPTNDMAMLFSYERDVDLDLSPYVKEVNIDTGKNDIGGGYKKGKCSLTMGNTDGELFPANPDSTLYTFFKVGDPITVTATYDAVVYPLFKGRLTKIDPPLSLTRRDVYADISDLFDPLQSKKVSLGVQSGKTASQLIITVLTVAGVTSYDVQDDVTVLNTVTWNEQGALDLLKKIVEVGQHSHFADATGKYIFRSNQWPSDGNPKLVLDLDSPCVEVAGAKQSYDVVNLANRIRIKYPTNNYFEAKDAGSIAVYGQRDYQMDNELMPNEAYAKVIGEFIASKKMEPRGNMEIEMQEKFPYNFSLVIGDLLQITHTPSGLDEKVQIVGITQRILKAGEVATSYRCEKWISPPVIVANAFDFEYVADKDYLVTDGLATSYQRGQSFVAPANGIKLIGITIKFRAEFTGVRPNGLFILGFFTTNVNQFPLATIADAPLAIGLTGNVFDGEVVFEFTSLPTVTPGTRYAWALTNIPQIDQTLVSLHIYGDDVASYADGKPFYYNAGWIEIANREHWAKVRLGQ